MPKPSKNSRIKQAKKHGVFVLSEGNQQKYYSRRTGKYLMTWVQSNHQCLAGRRTFTAKNPAEAAAVAGALDKETDFK